MCSGRVHLVNHILAHHSPSKKRAFTQVTLFAGGGGKKMFNMFAPARGQAELIKEGEPQEVLEEESRKTFCGGGGGGGGGSGSSSGGSSGGGGGGGGGGDFAVISGSGSYSTTGSTTVTTIGSTGSTNIADINAFLKVSVLVLPTPCLS
jgi:hypothetical protein